jgi:hypothetical protein
MPARPTTIRYFLAKFPLHCHSLCLGEQADTDQTVRPCFMIVLVTAFSLQTPCIQERPAEFPRERCRSDRRMSCQCSDRTSGCLVCIMFFPDIVLKCHAFLADEPTSGLDSTTAMHLLTTLRELASGGRAVVTTIHQPSSRLYFQLDKLLLLSEGHVMYYGEPYSRPSSVMLRCTVTSL